MRLTARFFLLNLLCSSVRSAVDLNGEQVVEPVTDDDPAPISDSQTYYPEQDDCPLACDDMSNINAWTPYHSVDRLQRCQQPILLKLSVSQLVDDPSTTILIRTCTLGALDPASGNTTGVPADVENPKLSDDLFRPSLDIAPACFSKGTEVSGKVTVSSTAGSGLEGDVPRLIRGMQDFFDHVDNCDENFVFAYHKRTVIGTYIGTGLGKPTVKSVFEAIGSSGTPGRTNTQLCDSERGAERALGISIDNDLARVQKTLLAWSQGTCVDDPELGRASEIANVKIFDITQARVANTTGNAIPSSSANISSDVSVKTASASVAHSSSAPSTSLSSVSINGVSTAVSGQEASSSTTSSRMLRMMRRSGQQQQIDKRATCRYVKVESGDGCESLAKKCGISGSDFMKYNSATNYCSTLKPGDYACCSSGDRYTEPKPDPPKPGSDGTCATHLISDGDTCDALAKRYGLTTDTIEKYNKGKTWAWTECKSMLVGYNMCLSSGTPPLPPSQQGSECGPIVAGTTWTNKSIPMTELNPCPLKACCSNWGYCGPYPAHCDIHAPSGGGPGTKLPGYESTCISNCGNEIKRNSGPPAVFSRIGYYESWNLGRDCLFLNAKDANTDGTYTHIHWGFVDIDPNTWKPVVNDSYNQWAEFKSLQNVKRIISFGGWAYSTEPATYNIIRKAIIDNRETFASNIAVFLQAEGIDGVDIDWEYPGAPDILVNGQVIGQKTDGVNYLRFLTTLKQKVGSSKSVSIAAPASYWYLKAFPIDRIAAAIDYIVYMTYDLHGQWDYGNVNAFDACPSGKCIRSHINLTETNSALSIITKAGVPNNKIFVGEASYGRSFRMATDGCWGPMCDFTGSRTKSNANPGRCTKTAGYISYAEISEILSSGDFSRSFHDGASNSDILLYKGDYVSYMTPTTKDTRRNDWKGLNFGGSIDWALDLQAFRAADLNSPPKIPAPGQEGCIQGIDNTLETASLCEFACSFDFCPEPLCTCETRGPVPALPAGESQDTTNIIAFDEFNVDVNRLCKFTCGFGYCPDDTCTTIVIDEDEEGYVITPEDEYEKRKADILKSCTIYKERSMRDQSVEDCRTFCQPTLDQAKEEGRTTNLGCVGFYPGKEAIPWTRVPGFAYTVAPGQCFCDNYLMNTVTQIIVDALPVIGQIGCYLLMSSLKFVIDVGANYFTGGSGKILNAGVDMLANAAQLANYIYSEVEDPVGAFDFWLSPCGGDDLVPDQIKKAFDILNSVSDGLGSFKRPKNIPKGSGRKGDDANPTDRKKPKGGTGKGPNGDGISKKTKCRIRAGKSTTRLGVAKNTFRKATCVDNKTQKREWVVKSLAYAANAQPTAITKTCSARYSHACYFYSSATRVNPQWATITCNAEAATTRHRLAGGAVRTWKAQHSGADWTATSNRPWPSACQVDEYPPAHLLHSGHPAYINSGANRNGQLVHYVPSKDNIGAGQSWKGVCIRGALDGLSDAQFESRVENGGRRVRISNVGLERIKADITADLRPEFSWGSWGHSANPLRADGIFANPCLPRAALAANDPGFVMLTYDPWYQGQAPPLNYRAPHP